MTYRRCFSIRIFVSDLGSEIFFLMSIVVFSLLLTLPENNPSEFDENRNLSDSNSSSSML